MILFLIPIIDKLTRIATSVTLRYFQYETTSEHAKTSNKNHKNLIQNSNYRLIFFSLIVNELATFFDQ